jgi:hypothetical protein
LYRYAVAEFDAQLVLKEVLGSGASGVVHLAAWKGRNEVRGGNVQLYTACSNCPIA